MFFNIAGLLIGIIILLGSVYYLIKEKNDKQSQKIYSIFSVIGAVIVIAMTITLLV
ncbi:MAG: hypothetical protein Q4F63_01465 [Clostridia bacterium]|nr:hypothetical protein [Clostridia bacterium]